jgi:DNA-binding transcriptional LysR family regulator
MSNHIELRHLIYFSVLAEELHFRKAAERLYISQPGLTRQIKQMEEIYQAPLFERGKRSVKLTNAGIFLKAEVDILISQLDNISIQIKKIADGKITDLSIGFIGSAAQSIMPDLLYQLSQDFPLIEVSMNELPNNTQVEFLQSNKLDFGFVRTAVPPIGLMMKKISDEPFSLVIPQSYPIQQHNFTSLTQFKDESFILFSRDYSNAYYELVMSVFSDHGFIPQVHHKTVNALSIFKLVEKGLGVAIVPSSLRIGYDIPVHFIELEHIPQRSQLSLLWNPKNRNSGIPALLEVLQKSFST